MAGWTLLIDFGAASTVAATLEDGAFRLIDFDGVPWTPSAVCWSEDRHELIAGRAARRLSITQPWHSEDRLGSRLGENQLLLGDEQIAVVDAVATLLAHVARHAIRAANGRPPVAVLMTNPTPRASSQVKLLRAAADAAGLPNVELIPAPVAVAASLPPTRLRPGDRLAVYDLGATGSEVSVLRRTGASFELIGHPRHNDVGGDEFDRKLIRFLNERLARERQQSFAEGPSEGPSRTSHTFAANVRAAKERLSWATTVSVELPPPLEGALTLSRGELESLIEGAVFDTVSQLKEVADEAGGVRAVYLAGACTQIPLVSRLIAAEMGLPAETSADPRAAAVRGLAKLSRQALHVPIAATADACEEPEALNALDEDVQFTVYRPQRVEPGSWYALLAFAHKSDPVVDEILGVSDPVEVVRDQAAARLGASLSNYARTEQDSSHGLARGSELTFIPRADGVEFNPPSRTFRWQEPVHQEEFRMRADARLQGMRARGAVSVYLGVLLIAEVSLNIRVGGAAETASSGLERARPYRRIFFSYSHRDTAVVEQVEQVLSSLGDEVMRDARALRSGEVWGERIEQMIRYAEIFQLFWSTNSMTSEFVSKEWRYALTLARPNFIRPTYWEQPMPELPDVDLPPAELRRLHFHPLPAPAVLSTRSASATTIGAAPSTSDWQSMSRDAQQTMSWDAPRAEAAAPALPRAAADTFPPIPASPPQQRPARPRLLWTTRLSAGMALVVIAVGVVGSFALTRIDSSTQSALNRGAPAQTSSGGPPADERTTESPQEEHGGGPSCAGCEAAGADCPKCVVRTGVGATDIGPITSARGFLTWKSAGGGWFVMILDGHLVTNSMRSSGRLALPARTYSDLRIEAQGAWSIAIH
jgi:actin-like ATPase involved in cell morphogenesis